MKEAGEGVSRRRALLGALAAAGAVILPASPRAESVPKHPRPDGFKELDTSDVKPSEKIKWFADNLGPNGKLWPMLRDGDFTDNELKVLLRALASVSRALNNPSVEDLKDERLAEMRKSIPSIDSIPHLYTISFRVKNGGGIERWYDYGNAQVYTYQGKAYIQSSKHVVEGIARHHPDILTYFRAPSEKKGRPVDVTFAPLSRVPTFDSGDALILQMPSKLDTTTCHGQINVVMGYKDDGGAQSFAGIVLPTPRKMRKRLDTFWTVDSPHSPESLAVIEAQEEGGLFLMPAFLGETSQGGDSFRAAGRSGSFRLVYSPQDGYFVPASNFASGRLGVDAVTGMFRGWVDSMTHVVRGLREISAYLGREAVPTILPRHVPRIEPGTFEIAPGVYLRSVRRRIQAHTTASSETSN